MSNILSPRRLEKIRQNGKDILATSNGLSKSSGLDTHKVYNRNQMKGMPATNQPVAAAHNMQDKLDVELDLEGQTKMHLVPCRWSRSGWKYVEVDPIQHNFFKNPNRVNSFGVASPSKVRKGGSVVRRDFGQSKSAFVQGNEATGNQTTYGRSFVQAQRQTSQDNTPWKTGQSGQTKADGKGGE